MTLLVIKNSKEKYLERMKLSESAKIQTKYVLQRFDTFCQRTQQKPEDEVIEELKILKKTKTEDEYKEVLYNEILQPFVNELAEFYDPMAVKGLFSYFKGYLVSWGIVIYKEETKIFLRFPEKCQDEKHVFTKNEVWIQQGIRKEPLSVDDCYIIEGNIYDSNTLGNNFGTKFDVAWIELEKFTQVDCLEAISPTVAENNVPQTKQVESAIITLEKVQLSLRMF